MDDGTIRTRESLLVGYYNYVDQVCVVGEPPAVHFGDVINEVIRVMGEDNSYVTSNQLKVLIMNSIGGGRVGFNRRLFE